MKRHPIDWFSLIAGLFVTAVATAALLGPRRFEVGPWVWPSLLVLVGIGIIVLVLTSSRRSSDAEPFPDTATDADPERHAALQAAYDELDDEVTLPLGDRDDRT